MEPRAATSAPVLISLGHIKTSGATPESDAAKPLLTHNEPASSTAVDKSVPRRIIDLSHLKSSKRLVFNSAAAAAIFGDLIDDGHSDSLDDHEDEEEEGGNGEGNSSTQRLRPNTKFLARFVGGIERVNKRLIAESSSNSSSSGTGSGTGSAGGWGAGGDKDAALAALLPPMPANPQDFEAWQAQGEARILQLAEHYGFFAILKAKELSEITGSVPISRSNIFARLGKSSADTSLEAGPIASKKRKVAVSNSLEGTSTTHPTPPSDDVAISAQSSGAQEAAAAPAPQRRKLLAPGGVAGRGGGGLSANLFKAAMGRIVK